MDKELKNKDLEEVSGGSTEFEPKIEPIFDPEPKIKPIFDPAEAVCPNRNNGTEACFYSIKGQSKQCVGCSRNHD